MKKVNLPDNIRLINAHVDGYGDVSVMEEAHIRGAFFQGTATRKENNTDLITTYDAHCYVDETAPMVVDNGFRLEGMYIVVSLYGYPEKESWYKIADVKLGVTKITDNVVNNCHCFLQKVEALEEGD